uniref:Uncharacterized protein n=1 Tax=Knipowitschia caucasica TaxID=637954 RepID=A0AAV2LAY7_KNICA
MLLITSSCDSVVILSSFKRQGCTLCFSLVLRCIVDSPQPCPHPASPFLLLVSAIASSCGTQARSVALTDWSLAYGRQPWHSSTFPSCGTISHTDTRAGRERRRALTQPLGLLREPDQLKEVDCKVAAAAPAQQTQQIVLCRGGVDKERKSPFNGQHTIIQFSGIERLIIRDTPRCEEVIVESQWARAPPPVVPHRSSSRGSIDTQSPSGGGALSGCISNCAAAGRLLSPLPPLLTNATAGGGARCHLGVRG